MTIPHRLNVGCGRDVRPGWCNLNDRSEPAMQLDRDLVGDVCAGPYNWYSPQSPIPPAIFGGNGWFNEIEASHVIEHVSNDLAMMENLWMVARPDCKLTVRCPYGTSDDADDDPTHVRRMHVGRWGYYSQPYYWRADYGYRGDWQPVVIKLRPYPDYLTYPDDDLSAAVRSMRNVIEEMVVELRAVKPAREPDKLLQVPPKIEFDRG
jgi:hypothetical protein